MRFWFSPLPLLADLISELAAAGLQPWPNGQGSPHGDTCILVYDSPERHISAAAEAEAVFTSRTLAEGYSELLGCKGDSGQPLLAGWRLQRMGGLGLQQWLAGNGPRGVVGNAEPISSLVASVILSLLDAQPQLLDAYNDLELQAELLGSEPDLTYCQRMQQAISQADPLPELLAVMQTCEGELQKARHEAEGTLLELQQLREKLKQLVVSDGQKQQLLDTRNQEHQILKRNIQALQQELQQKVDNMERHLQNRDRELQDARNEAEHNRMELNQVGEELQKLYLADFHRQQLLDTHTHELQNMQANRQAMEQQLHIKVDNLEQQLRTREEQMQDTRKEAEFTLMQLHQVQEELERLFLADRQKKQLLDTRNHELQTLKRNLEALQQELQPKADYLEQQLQTREKQMQDTRKEAELTLTQLHQVQEELEQLFLADLQKQQLLDTRNHELQTLKRNLEALQQELQPKVDYLEQQLQTSEKEMQDIREEARLTLLQLHQVQEELERYFLQTRAGSGLIEAQKDQLNRSKQLLAKITGNDFRPRNDVVSVAVEVMPPGARASEHPSLQLQALLKTYATSLNRANEILSRAISR